MDVPESMLDEIKSQFHSDEERKTAVLRVCLADHPKPTWELVSDVIYMIGVSQCSRETAVPVPHR